MSVGMSIVISGSLNQFTMIKILKSGIYLISLLGFFTLNGQFSKCATMHILERNMERYPDLKDQMEKNEIATQNWLSTHSNLIHAKSQIIKIPVVFHVIWHDSIENISDQQIYSQLDVLNRDFRLLNKDSLPASHPFHKYVGDAGVEFCLATVDPGGKVTTGITRTYTSVTTWPENAVDNIKSTAKGGRDNWSPVKYLNIYIVNMEGETLGFSSFPDELTKSPQLDGVVIRYEAFGTLGTAGIKGFETNNRGRTATHEIGHWLNLIHIWGDQMCGDDKVADTAPAEGENKFCPKFPQRPNNKCGTDSNGEMYMNFMDYVEDSCMAMFTLGQVNRMLAAVNMFRPSLLTSNACTITGSEDLRNYNSVMTLRPNPNHGIFTCKINQSVGANCAIIIFNSLGVQVKHYSSVVSDEIQIDCTELNSGLYYLLVSANANAYVEKFVLNK